MPNHIHVVIVINNNQISPVGADLCVGPNQGIKTRPDQGAGGHISPPLQGNIEIGKTKTIPLFRMFQWYKTMTTTSYIHGVKKHGWKRFKDKLWQRSFYDHIIRSEKTLDNIREYISGNPWKWELDAENGKNNADREKYYKNIFDK
jgi:hypothetical protein